jgi:hypothetical protein
MVVIDALIFCTCYIMGEIRTKPPIFQEIKCIVCNINLIINDKFC